MKPGKLDLPTIWRGCTWPVITLTWLDSNGDPIDLTGWTPSAHSKSINLNAAVTDAVNGVTTISLTKTQTANLKLGEEQWDWIWSNNGTKLPPLLAGTVKIKEPTTSTA